MPSNRVVVRIGLRVKPVAKYRSVFGSPAASGPSSRVRTPSTTLGAISSSIKPLLLLLCLGVLLGMAFLVPSFFQDFGINDSGSTTYINLSQIIVGGQGIAFSFPEIIKVVLAPILVWRLFRPVGRIPAYIPALVAGVWG